MGSCYLADHIVGNHIHTDLTTSNIEKPQQKYHLRTVSNRLLGVWGWGGGGGRVTCFTGSKHSPFASVVVRNIFSAWKFPNPAFTQKTNNSLIRPMMNRQKNLLWHLEFPWVSNNTTDIPEKKKTTGQNSNDQAQALEVQTLKHFRISIIIKIICCFIFCTVFVLDTLYDKI